MAGDGDDEEIVPGTEGQDTPGSDPGAGDDEGEVSAEHTDEEADDGEQEVDPAPPQRGGRAESRIQRLANEAKAAREEAARWFFVGATRASHATFPAIRGTRSR